MRRFWLCSILACSTFLSSCSNLKNIQDLTYIVGIGMDFDKDKKEYKVYLQGLNFANVAKQEGSKPAEPIPIYIATATGETLNLAVRKLYKKSEPPLFFGHVNTLVLSQDLVSHRFKEVIEEIGRNRSLRGTIRVITTKEEIPEIFNVSALFNYPAVYTVLYKKKDSEVLQDEINPTNIMTFLREFHEPMGVAKLPNVKIDKNSWKAEGSYPVLFFNGYTIFQQQDYKSVLKFDQGILLDWLSEKKVSLNKEVKKEGKLVAAVKLGHPKMKVKYQKDTPSPKFSVEITVQGDLLESIQAIQYEELKKLIEDDIKSELTAIYQDGVKSKIDILNVGEKWYRKHPKKYSELKKSQKYYLDKDSLKDLKVKVEIFHFNAYQFDKKGDEAY